MTEYTAGDLVEAVKGETVTRGRLKADGDYLWVGDSGRTPENLESYGFTLSIIEKAAAVVVLPTEPGWYLDKDKDIWTLTDSGTWIDEWGNLEDPKRWAPLTRLEPVSVTAKKVLDRVRKVWPLYNDRDLEVLAAEFGVEL